MKRTSFFILLIGLTSPWALAQREAGYGPLYLQGMLGVLDAGRAWTLEDEATGQELESDLGRLIYGGGMAAQMTRDGIFEYGFEGGGFVSWKNSNQIFYASNHVFGVSFDNDMFLIDLSLGGAVSWRPVKPFRLYLGAGPSLVVGTVNIKDDSVEAASQQQESSSLGGRDWAVTGGLYARVGFEFLIDNFSFGVSARRTTSVLEFDHAGEIDLRAPQWFLTIGKRI